MNRLMLAASVALLLSTSPAFADPGGHGHGNGNQGHERGDDEHGHEHGNAIARGDGDDHDTRDHRDWRREDDRDGRHHHNGRHAQDWRAEGLHDNGRHLGQRRHAWERGQRLPHSYLDQRYYVNDYATYHLTAPPPGYRWVRPYPDNNRYYLVQTVSGLISRILGGP